MPTSVSHPADDDVDFEASPLELGVGASNQGFVGDPADSWLGYESCHPLTWLPHSPLLVDS